MAVPAIAAKAVVSAAGKQAAKSAVKKDIAKGVAAGTKRTTEKVVQKRMAASLKRQASQQVLDGIGKVSKQMLPNNGKGLPTNLYDGASKLAQGAISGEGASQAAKDAAGDVLAKGAETAVNKGLDVASKAGPAPVRVAAKLGKKVMQSDAAREKLKDAAKAGMPDLKKDGEEDSEKDDGGSFLNPFGKKGKKGLAGKLLRAGVPMIALQAISFALPILLLVGVMLSVGSCAAAGIFGLTSGGGESNREIIEQGSGAGIPRVQVEEAKGFCDEDEPGTSELGENGKMIVDFMKKKGIDGLHIAAIMGNWKGEGHWDESKNDFKFDQGEIGVDPDSEAYGKGIASFTGAFRHLLDAEAAARGKEWTDGETQLDVWYAVYSGDNSALKCNPQDHGLQGPNFMWRTNSEPTMTFASKYNYTDFTKSLQSNYDDQWLPIDDVEEACYYYYFLFGRGADVFSDGTTPWSEGRVDKYVANAKELYGKIGGGGGGAYTDRGDCIEKNKSTSVDGWVLYNQCSPNWDLEKGALQSDKETMVGSTALYKTFGSSCGQVAMAMVCATYGGDSEKYTPTWLRSTEMRYGDQGLNQPGCVSYMNAHQDEFHLKASSGHWDSEEGSWDKMKKICDDGGCIVIYQVHYSQGGRHWVTVIDVEGDMVKVANPATGEIEELSKSAIVADGCPDPSAAPCALYFEKI